MCISSHCPTQHYPKKMRRKMCVNHLLITNILFLSGHKPKVFLQLILQANFMMKVCSLRYRHVNLIEILYIYMFNKIYIQLMVRNVGNLVWVTIIYSKTKGHCPKRTHTTFCGIHIRGTTLFSSRSWVSSHVQTTDTVKVNSKKFSNYLSHSRFGHLIPLNSYSV